MTITARSANSYRLRRRVAHGEYAGIARTAVAAQTGIQLSEVVDWAELVEDHPYLASQVPRRHATLCRGERALLAELLYDAIDDLRGMIPWRRTEAEEWVRDRYMDDWQPQLRFGWVCEVLGLNPGAVRRALLRSLD